MGTVLVIMAGVTYIIYNTASEMMEFLGEQRYQTTLAETIHEFSKILMGVEISLNKTLPDVEDNLRDKAMLGRVLTRLVDLNPAISGAAVAFQPGFYPREGRWYEPYARRITESGPDSAKVEMLQVGSEEHDYLNAPWYAKVITTGEGCWTDPYEDDFSDSGILCSYTQPVRDERDSIVAVLIVDVSLKWLTEQLHDIDLRTNEREFGFEGVYETYSFVISRDGTYIVHPDHDLILNGNYFDTAEATPDSTDDSIGRSMIRGEKAMAEFRDSDGKQTLMFYAPIERTGWSMAIVVPKVLLKVWAIVLEFIIVTIMLLGMIVLFFVCRTLVRRVARPLTYFADSAEEIANGKLDAALPEIKSDDELRQLYDSFLLMQTSLRKQMDELRRVNEQRGRIEGELKAAQDIQMSMLPKTFPPYPDRDDVDIYGSLVPAKAVGGDLYDFYIRDEKLFFCIGDVSGKGVPASLVMAVTRSLFRTVSAREANPERIMAHINEAMSDQNDSMMFVTLFVGVLDLPTGKLRYCNAGHDAPLIIADDVTTLTVEPNLPVGVARDWRFRQQETAMPVGACIFLFTDGLTEAEDATHAQFTMQRVTEVAAQALRQRNAKPEQLVNAMMRAVHLFVGDAEQSDDLTMLSIQFTKAMRNELYHNGITLPNDIQQIPRLSAFVDEVCEAVGLDMATAMQMNLALEEAVVNVMNYAYPAGTKGDVDIEALANDIRLKFVITDGGQPFDPTAKEEADTTLSAEERPIGGLGIFLVRQLMDSINYEYAGGKNILTLRKRLTRHDDMPVTAGAEPGAAQPRQQ